VRVPSPTRALPGAVHVPPPGPVLVPPPATPPQRLPPQIPAAAAEGAQGLDAALLYRRIAGLLAERATAEARIERAQAESAAADEQVGQMLVRVAEVEGRLRAAQKTTADADERTRVAEVQTAELRAQINRLRQSQVELAERFSAGEARALVEAREVERLRGALSAAQRDAETARATEGSARAQLRDAVEQLESLRSQLDRAHEESRALGARIAELEAVRVERDEAKLHEELLEIHLTTARSEVDKARRHALSGQHRLGAELKDRVSEIDRLAEELAGAVAQSHALEKDLAASQREADEARASARAAQSALSISEGQRRELEAAANAAGRALVGLEQDLARAREERAEQTLRQREAERHAEALRAELDAFRAETEAGRARLDALEIERELHDGMAAEARRAHEAEAKRLRDEAAEALSRGAEAMTMAEQFRSEMTAARRERDTLSTDAQRTRRDLEKLRARAERSRAEFRGVVEAVSRALSDLEKREVEVARLRAGAIGATRDLLDRAVSVEHALAGALEEYQEDHAEAGEDAPG
jgi:chromosome segregation ATPase